MVTIDDIINLIDDEKKRNLTATIFKQYKDEFMLCQGSVEGHHLYHDGGLHDHVVLVAMICYVELKKMPTELFLLYNVDDVLISSIFHDFDKLGRLSIEKKEVFFNTHAEVVEMLEDEGLIDDDSSGRNIRDGIMHSHGRWSHDESFGSTSIILHQADMIASKLIKSREETGRFIKALSKYIFE